MMKVNFFFDFLGSVGKEKSKHGNRIPFNVLANVRDKINKYKKEKRRTKDLSHYVITDLFQH